MIVGLIELIKRFMSRVNEIDSTGLEECDTCGQISHLDDGLCEWCQKVYESNK